MSDITDIPIRDEKDGEAQLALLKSYLKNNTAFTDDFLINLLVVKSALDIWLELVGSNSNDLPFSYDPLSMIKPINRVRSLTGDTNELDIKYTDKELLSYLEVIPLRYVVDCIKLVESDAITSPRDLDHPLTILRTYLQTGDELIQSDGDLIELLFSSGMNPFGVVIDHMERDTSLTMASTAANTGNSLASIDGITFSNPTDDSALIQQSLDAVGLHAARSVYSRDPVYGMFSDAENLAKVDWEAKWYAI